MLYTIEYEIHVLFILKTTECYFQIHIGKAGRRFHSALIDAKYLSRTALQCSRVKGQTKICRIHQDSVSLWKGKTLQAGFEYRTAAWRIIWKPDSMVECMSRLWLAAPVINGGIHIAIKKLDRCFWYSERLFLEF